MKKPGLKKKIHPRDRPRKFRDIKGTTSLAGNFIYYIVNYFLDDISQKPGHEKPAVGGDVYMLPVIACVLLAVDLEAIRNDLFFKKKKPIKKNSDIGADIASLFSEVSNFPQGRLSQAINEVFVVRDSIIHGHLYEVRATYYHGTKYSPFEMGTRNYRHKRISSKIIEQRDKKFFEHVNLRHKKTKYLKLNANPLHVNYADLFILLMLYDVLDSAYAKMTGGPIFRLPFSIHGMLMGSRSGERPEFVDDIPGSLGQVLGHYYQKKVRVIKDRGRVLVGRTREEELFKKKINQVIKLLKRDFEAFVPIAPVQIDKSWIRREDICFLVNTCPKCKASGFKTPFKRFGKCWRCKYEDPGEKTSGTPFFTH